MRRKTTQHRFRSDEIKLNARKTPWISKSSPIHTQDRGHYGYTLNFGVKNAQLRCKTASSSTTLKVEVFLEGGKTAQLRSKTASSSTTLKVEVFLEGEKTAQLRSKTASSSTTLKVEVFLEGEKTTQLRSKTASSSTTLFSWSLHGHYAVTTRSLRGHYGHYAVTAVTTRSLRSLRGHYGHYAVTTVTTRSLRSLRGHYGRENAQLRSKTDYLIKTLLP